MQTQKVSFQGGIQPKSLNTTKAFERAMADILQHSDKDAYILRNNKKLPEKVQGNMKAAKKFFENCTRVIDEFLN